MWPLQPIVLVVCAATLGNTRLRGLDHPPAGMLSVYLGCQKHGRALIKHVFYTLNGSLHKIILIALEVRSSVFANPAVYMKVAWFPLQRSPTNTILRFLHQRRFNRASGAA